MRQQICWCVYKCVCGSGSATGDRWSVIAHRSYHLQSWKYSYLWLSEICVSTDLLMYIYMCVCVGGSVMLVTSGDNGNMGMFFHIIISNMCVNEQYSAHKRDVPPRVKRQSPTTRSYHEWERLVQALLSPPVHRIFWKVFLSAQFAYKSVMCTFESLACLISSETCPVHIMQHVIRSTHLLMYIYVCVNVWADERLVTSGDDGNSLTYDCQ